MAPQDAVATLNKVAQGHDRFKVRPSDMFSPEKTQHPEQKKTEPRRTSLRLQQRTELQPSTNRRDPYDIPGDEADLRPAPKPKRKIAINKDKEHELQSPLKKQGYDIPLKDNPNVYLADSPAKHTRSKDHNPPKAALQVKASESKKSSSSNQRHKVSVGTRGKTVVPVIVTPTRSNPRKRQSGAESEHGDQEDDPPRSVKRARKEADKDKHLEQNEQPDSEGQDNSQSLNNSQDEVEEREPEPQVEQPVGASSEHPRKRGRPRKTIVTEHEEQDRQTQESSPQQDQSDQATNEEPDEFEKCRASFIQKVQDAIKLNSCENFWSRLGAAALMIKKHRTGGREFTDQGKSFINLAKRLINCYNELLKSKGPQSKTELTIVECLDELERRCQLLEPPSIEDVYLHVIPMMVTLLKKFLECRFQGSAFDEPALRELIRLLTMSFDLCTRAKLWQPRPKTLEPGILKWVRNDISPNLKHIQERFSSEARIYDRLERDLAYREKLNKNMANARQNLQDRCEQAKAMRKSLRERRGPLFMYVPPKNISGRTPVKHATITGTIHDVDEFDGDANNQLTQDDGVPDSSVSMVQETEKAEPRLRREPTVEIPPPLRVNLSEEEKVALLNGLQLYTDRNRFNEILDDPQLGSILKQRDLDDLMEAARSFSQTMASKMGMEVYQSDQSLSWLRSTDPSASIGMTNDV